MTDFSARSIEEMASEFIVGTCQLIPKSQPLASDRRYNMAASCLPAPKEYAIVSGSAMEFYIRPLNPCISDTDFLLCQADELVCNGDFPVLPSDISGLSDTIKCFAFESYDNYPGFIQLRVLGEMKYNWNITEYEFSRTADPSRRIAQNVDPPEIPGSERLRQALRRSTLQDTACGPAIKCHPISNNHFGGDMVNGLFCPHWPKQAQNWPIRLRYRGWPTSNTISEVVQNGCHVVYAQHRSCRHDALQWRLSFSLAEVILLQSWTQTQQIVYHLLRFFAKRELIQEDIPKDDEVLCPYHLKTLMLWTCEETSLEYWNSSSVIAICCELLQKLLEWLKKGRCSNYFIPEANLFFEPSNSTERDKIERRLKEFRNSDTLAQWFVENYIQPITRQLFQSPEEVEPDFMDCMLPFLEFRQAWKEESVDVFLAYFFSGANDVCRGVLKYGLSSGLYLGLIRNVRNAGGIGSSKNSKLAYLPTTEKNWYFHYHTILLYVLHFAHGLRYGELSMDSNLFLEFVEAISMQPKIVRSQYHNYPKMYSARSRPSRFYFLRAQSLLVNLTGSNSRSEFRFVSIMTTRFLRKALECDDSKSSGIAPAALAYLAALHFTTSEYKEAKRCCLAVLEDHTPKSDKETLNAGCLLFIEDIARIIGLCMLQKITDDDLYYIDGQLYLDLRLSPEMFAHYLTLMADEGTCKSNDFYHDLPNSAFPMDKNVKAFMMSISIAPMTSGTDLNPNKHILYRRTDSFAETEVTAVNNLLVKETVIDVLMEIASENMTSFWNVIYRDFGIQCNTNDCYRALYLYKCRQYNEVMGLCERILEKPDLQTDLKEFAYANVVLLPPLDSFFDRDVQSLLGFHTMFYYLSPLNDVMGTVELTAESTFEHWFANGVKCDGTYLAAFLFARYSVKRHYFLGRHFLARYLKVRCCIDCDLPYKETMTEFASQKTNLPFEHIIRKFVLQRFVF